MTSNHQRSGEVVIESDCDCDYGCAKCDIEPGPATKHDTLEDLRINTMVDLPIFDVSDCGLCVCEQGYSGYEPECLRCDLPFRPR